MQYRVVALSLALIAPCFVVGGDDTTPPELKSLQFVPAAIDTSASAAEVTISFTATDDASGVNYIEATFVDPSGVARQSASMKISPTRSAENALRISFPRFSNAGTWILAHVFLSDAAGNTLVLDANAMSSRGFRNLLEVTSAKDTTPPRLSALSFAPSQIDTSSGPADLKVDYTATDDLAGVSYIELSFVSPSGVFRRGGSVKFNGAQSISKSMTVTFPRLSEAGQWTLNNLFLADAAGNTLVLNGEDLSGMGFPTSLEVKSTQDTVSPKLTALRFSPDAIDTRAGTATVQVDFTATDNLSGVASIELAFVSPSGVAKQSGSAKVSPATEVSKTIALTFPQSSETGTWALTSLILADAAGNTLVLDAEGLVRSGFPTNLTVR